MKKSIYFLMGLLLLMAYSCKPDEPIIKPKPTPEPEPEQRDSARLDTVNIERATIVWNSIMERFWIEDEKKIWTSYPHGSKDGLYYAAVWGYGAFVSAYNALYQRLPEEAFGEYLHVPSYQEFRDAYESKMWGGLEPYWNNRYGIGGYGAYIGDHGRFYDDNVWVGIDLIELYDQTKDERYLNKAKDVWKFIMKGLDSKFGGGVYWKEDWGSDENPSKNTCSNAPVAVFGMKLYNTTQDPQYRETATDIYVWTKRMLQDPKDKMMWDNIKEVDGETVIEEWKFPYNVGQMLQAAVLLYEGYKEEGGEIYLDDAMEFADAAYTYYFNEDFPALDGTTFKMLKNEDLWFNAIMFRGYAELYNADLDKEKRALANGYIEAFRKVLDYAWDYARDKETQFFYKDLSGRTKDYDDDGNPTVDFRYAGAITEMYARMATLNNK